LVGFALAAFVAAVLIVSLPLRSYVGAYERDVQSEVALRAGNALRLTMSRAIQREWDSLNALTQQIDMENTAGARSFTDAVVRASAAVEWVGVATPDGRVVAGSRRTRESEDVGTQAWFYDGIKRGTFASYQDRRATASSEASGLLNLSAPVIDRFGVTRGVIVYSLRLNWMETYLREAAEQLDVDFAVLDERGDRVIEVSNHVSSALPGAVGNLAKFGSDITRYIPAENGNEDYVMAVFPSLLTGDIPHFAWDLVVKVPAMTSNAGLSELMGHVRWAISGLFFLMAICAVLYARHYILPIERLTRDAEDIAAGRLVYPTDSSSSRESAHLSSALSVIQSRMQGFRRFGPGE
jgi:hypothetical protein